MGADPDGLGLRPAMVKAADLEDDPDRLFRDVTDWSVVDATGVARYRYNDRELHRAWADNAPKVRQFMMDNYIHFARIDGTHQGGRSYRWIGAIRVRRRSGRNTSALLPSMLRLPSTRVRARPITRPGRFGRSLTPLR